MRRFLAIFLGFLALAATPKSISSDIHWVPDDHFWRQGIIIVSLTKPKPAQAILDSGGVSESREKAKSDFETYYHGLPIEMAVGADYLANHRVVLGQPSENPITVPLDVRTQQHETVAFLSCDIGSRINRLSRSYR